MSNTIYFDISSYDLPKINLNNISTHYTYGQELINLGVESSIVNNLYKEEKWDEISDYSLVINKLENSDIYKFNCNTNNKNLFRLGFMNTIFKKIIYYSKKKILTEIDNLKIKINSYNLKKYYLNCKPLIIDSYFNYLTNGDTELFIELINNLLNKTKNTKLFDLLIKNFKDFLKFIKEPLTSIQYIQDNFLNNTNINLNDEVFYKIKNISIVNNLFYKYNFYTTTNNTENERKYYETPMPNISYLENIITPTKYNIFKNDNIDLKIFKNIISNILAKNEIESSPIPINVPDTKYVPAPINVPDTKYVPAPINIPDTKYVPAPIYVPDTKYVPAPINVPDTKYVPTPINVPDIKYAPSPINIPNIKYTPAPINFSSIDDDLKKQIYDRHSHEKDNKHNHNHYNNSNENDKNYFSNFDISKHNDLNENHAHLHNHLHNHGKYFHLHNHSHIH